MAEVILPESGRIEGHDDRMMATHYFMGAGRELSAQVGFGVVMSGLISAYCNLAISNGAVDEALAVLKLAVESLPKAAQNARLARGPVAGRA